VSVAFFRHDPARQLLCCEVARGFCAAIQI